MSRTWLLPQGDGAAPAVADLPKARPTPGCALACSPAERNARYALLFHQQLLHPVRYMLYASWSWRSCPMDARSRQHLPQRRCAWLTVHRIWWASTSPGVRRVPLSRWSRPRAERLPDSLRDSRTARAARWPRNAAVWRTGRVRPAEHRAAGLPGWSPDWRGWPGVLLAARAPRVLGACCCRCGWWRLCAWCCVLWGSPTPGRVGHATCCVHPLCLLLLPAGLALLRGRGVALWQARLAWLAGGRNAGLVPALAAMGPSTTTAGCAAAAAPPGRGPVLARPRRLMERTPCPSQPCVLADDGDATTFSRPAHSRRVAEAWKARADALHAGGARVPLRPG